MRQAGGSPSGSRFVEASNRRVRYERSRGPFSSLTSAGRDSPGLTSTNVNNDSARFRRRRSLRRCCLIYIDGGRRGGDDAPLVVVVAVSGKRLVALIWMWFRRQNDVHATPTAIRSSAFPLVTTKAGLQDSVLVFI